ncbi:hypothetical protein BV22DRAFT_998529 [Leucogyrophana mollusca]|uniref:Uncharacterized protein n=1 Tax=Leucogyrophana mollusca TaxID=85980 RepID=A0ACB8C1P5_9AGAM|nr:hypothetical protein BV22DRAFT_998529 [Leucogyrophana mollusca]
MPAQQPQPFSPPAGGEISPGSITYTTSTGPDGRVIYHPFSYQTPQGVVHGIQWVPAEATQILPQGAQPANAEFAASWNRGNLSRDDEKALEKWQRQEEKRRKKEEKEAIKRLSRREQEREEDIRIARERDAQARERRRSFYGETAPTPVGYPTPGSAAYGAYHSPSGGDMDRQFANMDLGQRERKLSSSYGTRPRKYSTSEADRSLNRKPSGNFAGERTSIYSSSTTGIYTTSPVTAYTSPTGYPTTAGYGGTNPYNRATSPFRQPSTYQTSPNVRPSDFGTGHQTSTYPGGPEPIARAASPYARAHSPYGARASSPIPPPRAPSPYARAPSPYAPGARAPSPYAPGVRAPSPYAPGARAPSPYAPGARAPSPYVPPGQIQSGVYPRGHIFEGQPIPRSRASSPMPGAVGGVAFPSSPRMPSAGVGADQQLAAPEAFSRPANAAQPYTPFNVMKIQEMDQFYDQIPRMPLVLDTHDVYHQDWIRFMNDIALAWAGKMPIPEFTRGVPPKRSNLVADLIDLWNTSFFLTRRVEVVLYKGRERRSGPNAGTTDHHLPTFDSDLSDSSDSSSSESDSDSERYPSYGRDLAESKRRRREKKEEKKRRKKEKKLRKKAKELEKQYALYLTYVPPREVPGSITGGFGFYA